LNAGEAQEMFGQIVKETPLGDTPVLNPEKVMMAKVAAYLVGWSFVGPDGNSLPPSESSFRNLKQTTFQEIADAITAHETAVADAQKKTNGGPV
jgi:hypothetical protein